MADPFPVYSPAADHPGTSFAAIVPSDSTDIPMRPRAVYIGGAGNVVAVDALGVTTTFVGLGAGCLLPIRPMRIKATGTTATAIVGIW